MAVTTAQFDQIAEYLSAVNAPGAFQSVKWTSEVQPAAAHRGTVLVKTTHATARTGVDYANMAAVAGSAVGDLPWGQWLVKPYVIEHKGSLYARIYIKAGSARTTYTVNGIEVTREKFGSYLTKSVREKESSSTGIATVKFENLTLIGTRTAA